MAYYVAKVGCKYYKGYSLTPNGVCIEICDSVLDARIKSYEFSPEDLHGLSFTNIELDLVLLLDATPSSGQGADIELTYEGKGFCKEHNLLVIGGSLYKINDGKSL